jgi:hypothetical protein
VRNRSPLLTSLHFTPLLFRNVSRASSSEKADD